MVPGPDTLRSRDILHVLISIIAFGLWISVERSVVVAYAPDGPLGSGWRWLAVMSSRDLGVHAIVNGALFCGAAILLGAAVHSLRRRRDLFRLPPGMWSPGWILFATEAVAFAMQLGRDGRWSVAATIAVLCVGRVSAGAVLWEALGIADLVRWLLRLLNRYHRIALGLIVLVPVCCTPFVKVEITGDESSYVFYALSLLRDGDLQFSPAEIRQVNGELGLTEGHLPHYGDNPDGSQAPRHYIGSALVILPALALADLFQAPLVPVCHAFMLLLCGITLGLAAAFAARITGHWGASLLAAAVIGVSFPMLGMSYQVYPDPMIATLVICAMLLMVPALKGRALTTRASCWILVICCLLPWFHGKFGMMSAALGILAVIFHGTWSIAAVVTLVVIVAGGIALFLGVNLPLLGDFMWKQAAPDYKPLIGIVAMFADGDSGLLPYAPWIIALPCGAVAMRRHGGRWRLTLALLLLALALWIPTGVFCWEGLASVLRYLTPIVVTWSPLLAAAFIVLRRRPLYLLVAACLIPVLAIPVFFEDPMKAYMPLIQAMRRIPDEMIEAFSWRELFPHYRWLDHGVDVPGAVAHGIWIVVVTGALAAALAFVRRNNWAPLAVLALAVIAAVSLGRIYDSPNWTVTATRMFRRQCKQLMMPSDADTEPAKRKSRVGVVRLQLPASVKPIERSAFARPDTDLSLRFPPGKGGDWIASGPEIRLPPGNYHFSVRGILRNDDPSTATLEVHISGIEPIEPHIFRRDVGPQSGVMESTPAGAVLVDGSFAPRRRTGKVQFHLHRVGPLGVAYSRLELECTNP